MTHRQLLDYLTRAALVGMAIFCGAARGGESDRTQAAPSAFLWQVAEIDLTSSKTYANPYGEVDVTVTFTGPRGESVTRPTFWDGGSAWKVRFAPTAVGSWNWQTECSDQTNDGLNGRSGRLECLPAEGGNPCYRHGFLQVSDNRRHFVHADGTPFFWLGDTHWQMPDTERLDACNHPEHAGQTCPHGGQFQHLVADRRAKGFTVYQTYPSATNPAWWTTPYTAINPQRFRDVFDVQMNHLAEQGFVIALGFGHFNNSTRIPVDDLRRWARYLVARYGAHPVVWITCQEMNAPEDGGRNRIDVWRAVAEEIQRNDGYGHPHSGHQWVLDARTRPLGNESWHDWFALQGGHRGSRLTPQARYAEYFALQPVKPVLETEAMYELVDCGGVADTDDARRSAWKALLCGCAGYTYGAAGVWALKWDPADTRWSNYNHRIDGWYAGMDLPGSRQMTVLKRFFLDIPWHSLTPRFSDPAWAQFTDREESVLATCGQDLFVAYFYGPSRSPGTLRNLDPGVSYRADWFDPRTGTWTPIDMTSEQTTASGRSRSGRTVIGSWLYGSRIAPRRRRWSWRLG